ncbi:alpha/beta hydrolase [Pseudomonas fontis]|uniref:Prolyl oligopeptidase family serine peptidase n=1 Tax=Pseudomonas fontis TaxID=2942633 RepID=A0ABT5NT62_9PSED|nr:prolyl oligopeptidase family serine peptidase [Pseudomonas fontis]MDD0975119.1 prolyl oligopeptidase family serine peptidase [Pseudomonas fontis]MDD0991339.1 prolyl oligopeptidase family serine peptidase [Pseudomonas fontis]
MRPALAQQLAIDKHRQALWGHSYGGLLVLHTLLTRPGAFSDYAAASPSLWWGNGVVLQELAGLRQRLGEHRPRLLVMRGDAEPAQPRPGLPVDNIKATGQLLDELRQLSAVQVGFKTFPGLNHGQMLEASLRYTLEQFYSAP